MELYTLSIWRTFSSLDSLSLQVVVILCIKQNNLNKCTSLFLHFFGCWCTLLYLLWSLVWILFVSFSIFVLVIVIMSTVLTFISFDLLYNKTLWRFTIICYFSFSFLFVVGVLSLVTEKTRPPYLYLDSFPWVSHRFPLTLQNKKFDPPLVGPTRNLTIRNTTSLPNIYS